MFRDCGITLVATLIVLEFGVSHFHRPQEEFQLWDSARSLVQA